MISRDGDHDGAAPTVESLNGSSFTSTSVEGFAMVPGTDVTFTFDRNGISAKAGCNTMFATIEIDDGVLSVGPMAQTRMACAEALMDQDAALIRFLESRPSLEVDDDVLTLTGSDVRISAAKVKD